MGAAGANEGGGMTLKFITNGGSIATLGTFHRVTKWALIRYVRKYERHWVNA